MEEGEKAPPPPRPFPIFTPSTCRSPEMTPVIKVYVTSITANTEVRKQVQRTLMVLEGLRIPFEAIDITKPGKEDERSFMREKAVNSRCSGPPLPPQFFIDGDYAGNYLDFEESVEEDKLEEFLHLTPTQPTEDPKGAANETELKANGAGEDDEEEGEDEDEEEGEEEEEGEGEDEESEVVEAVTLALPKKKEEEKEEDGEGEDEEEDEGEEEEEDEDEEEDEGEEEEEDEEEIEE